MTDNQSELLSQAIAGLQLRDIVLFSSSFKRPAPMPDASELEVVLQSRREVHFVRGEASESGDAKQLLQVLVDLGLRVVGEKGEKENSEPIYAEFEAEFLAEYEVRADVTEVAIKVFSELNSVHNVWPFWRQHIFDTVHRARLPHIVVPLFAGQPRRETPVTKGDSTDSSR